MLKISKARDTNKTLLLTSLSKNKIIGSEKLAKGSSTNGIHGTRLEVHENGPRDISTSCGFIEVYIDAFKLKIRISIVCSYRFRGKVGENSYFPIMNRIERKSHNIRMRSNAPTYLLD